MKSIAVLFAIFAVNAFAAPGTTVTQTTTTVDVHRLACVQPSTGGIYTELRSGGPAASIFLGQEPTNSIELLHTDAMADGCDIAKLRIIEDAALKRFGFLFDVPTTVKRTVNPSRRDANGNCLSGLIETVTIDLGNGVVLTSGLYGERSATDCLPAHVPAE